MPFMDGTGPLGNGPGAGRRRGMCAGARRGFGRGRDLGRRTGRGMGLGQRQANAAAPDTKTALEQQISILESQLDRVKQQLLELGSTQSSKQEDL